MIIQMNEFHGIDICDKHMLIVFSYIPYWWVGERSEIDIRIKGNY
jgi:hypothetical protein